VKHEYFEKLEHFPYNEVGVIVDLLAGKGKSPMPTAYSYIRFSHPNQAAGDSLRRQSERAEAYCQRHKLALDTSLTLRDLGVSAFKGKNAAVGNFRTFLDAIDGGKVAAGSVLIVESFDRISRQGIDEGYDLIKRILKKGIRIATLSPEREFGPEATKSLSKGALEIQLILERAAEESERKSERVGHAWAQKRKNAATAVVTRRLPGWVRYSDGNLVLDRAAAATIRRIYGLAREGLGGHAIAKKLNAERIPALGRKMFRGRKVSWSESIVYHLLTTRTVLGEYQPCKGYGADRKECGEPVKGYYPRVIDDDLFHVIQARLKFRDRGFRGRRGSHVNLFAGLLIDARDGGTLTYKHLSHRRPAIIPVAAKVGKGSRWASFPAEPFEGAILEKLREVTAADVQGDSHAGDKVEALAGQLAGIDALVKVWMGKMENPDTVDIVEEKLAEFNGKRKALAHRLNEAQREAASPLSDSWGEFRSLAELLAKNKSDDIRLKVRTALRRSIESVHCLFAGLGRARLAAVRIQFRSGTNRDYIIAYDPGRSNHVVKREGACRVESATWGKQASALDLRQPENAERAEKFLLSVGAAYNHNDRNSAGDCKRRAG
jgi:DNA invertase Pin-like site-specific DNA recombinase